MQAILEAGIKNTKAFLHMCEMSDKACHLIPDSKWHLVLLAVQSCSKRCGIGSEMLQKCIIPYIKSNGGGVLTFNTNVEGNRAFYKKMDLRNLILRQFI